MRARRLPVPVHRAVRVASGDVACLMPATAVPTARDLTADGCPVCDAAPGQACDRTVIGEWFAFPLPPPWTWWHGPVYVHAHTARVPAELAGAPA